MIKTQERHPRTLSRIGSTLMSGAIILAVTACASTEPKRKFDEASALTQSKPISSFNEDSTSSIAQITAEDQLASTYQIESTAQKEPLTVEQLRNYADRCGPEAVDLPPPDLDCSDLNLRIKRAYKTDDQVRDALITLDRLGRNTSAKSVSDDLKDGRADNSLNAQAVASGIFELPPPPPQTPPPEEVEDILTNGLIDAIIANSQGR